MKYRIVLEVDMPRHDYRNEVEQVIHDKAEIASSFVWFSLSPELIAIEPQEEDR